MIVVFIIIIIINSVISDTHERRDFSLFSYSLSHQKEQQLIEFCQTLIQDSEGITVLGFQAEVLLDYLRMFVESNFIFYSNILL